MSEEGTVGVGMTMSLIEDAGAHAGDEEEEGDQDRRMTGIGGKTGDVTVMGDVDTTMISKEAGQGWAVGMASTTNVSTAGATVATAAPLLAVTDLALAL